MAAFNKIHIPGGDEEKLSSHTRYRIFEYVVTPFGLCNAPGTFQSYINETLREFLHDFSISSLDDILIYSENISAYTKHFQQALLKLGATRLFLDIRKCDFSVYEVKYLDLIISTKGLNMDCSKVETIQNWKVPCCVKDVQSFLRFANFYQRFISGYSKIAAPLTSLTKTTRKSFMFPWNSEGPEQKTFESLKKAFTTDPLLAHFNPGLETWVKSDASDYLVAAVLSQKYHDGMLRPVLLMSKRMSPAKCNYEIYDKELLAIIRAFKECHPELAGTSIEDPIHVITDHKNLGYFMNTKDLNRRQTRWAEFLAEFNFWITYRPGKSGAKPDSLIRRPGDFPEDASDSRHLYQHQTVLKRKNLDHNMQKAFRLASLINLPYKEPTPA